MVQSGHLGSKVVWELGWLERKEGIRDVGDHGVSWHQCQRWWSQNLECPMEPEEEYEEEEEDSEEFPPERVRTIPRMPGIPAKKSATAEIEVPTAAPVLVHLPPVRMPSPEGPVPVPPQPIPVRFRTGDEGQGTTVGVPLKSGPQGIPVPRMPFPVRSSLLAEGEGSLVRAAALGKVGVKAPGLPPFRTRDEGQTDPTGTLLPWRARGPSPVPYRASQGFNWKPVSGMVAAAALGGAAYLATRGGGGGFGGLHVNMAQRMRELMGVPATGGYQGIPPFDYGSRGL